MSGSPTIPRLQILIAAALFSTGGAAIKSCSLTSWQLATTRSAIAGLALFLVFRSWRKFWEPKTLLVGAAYASTMILYVTSNKLTTAANTIFLQATAPVYLLLLGPWFLRERTSRSEWVLTSVIAVGMAMFFVGIDPPQVTAPRPLLGNLLAGISGLTWALTILGLRWLGRTQGSAGSEDAATGATAVGRAVIAGNFLAALFAFPASFPWGSWSGADLAIVSYLGLFQIGLAYVCMTFGVRHLGALEVSLLLLLEPVLNALWAWLLHAERPGPWSLAGCTIILVASVLRALAAGTTRPRPYVRPQG